MADFEITSPDGQSFVVTAPEGATQEQVLKYAQENFQAPDKAPDQPKWYELEKQPGVPKSNTERLKQVGQDFLSAAKNPLPGSLITAPITSAQHFAQQLGPDVAKATGSRLAGFAASAATDPISWMAGPETKLLSSVFSTAKKAGSGILKTVMKIGANVSDASIEQGAKAGWKLPNVAAHEVETAVENVQKVLKASVDDAGVVLNKAKTDLGLPVTVAEKELSLQKNGNIYGLGKEEINAATEKFITKHTDAKELAKDITAFKQGFSNTEPKLKAKVAMSLQDQVNEFVNWEKSGNQIEGLLKQQYRDLGKMVESTMPKSIRERMSKTLSLKDDLGKLLGLEENEGIGKAEQFLRTLFEAKSAKSKDYLKRFADLEVLTGEPVLSELFKKFAGQDLHKLAGRPFLAATAAGGALFNPKAALLLGAQSPRFLNAVGRMGGASSNAMERALKFPARGARGFTLNEMSESNKAQLDETMKRLKNAK